jgi:seryl-tRNA synthetase
MEVLIQLGPYIIAVISAAAAFITTKVQHKGKPENALIDQLQEQIASDRAANKQTADDMKADIKELKAEQKAAKKRERVRDDYIQELRKHIEDGNPPPPPPWPAGIYD